MILYSNRLRRQAVFHGALLLAAAILTGCETRDRMNPFDPRNPVTFGTPSVLNAVAGNQQVHLSWDLSRFQDIAQTTLLRRSSGDEITLLTQSGIGSGTYEDVGTDNGVLFTYRLQVIPQHGVELYSAPALATPGTSRPWVTDVRDGGVAELSPDGRNVLSRVAEGGEILDLEMEPDASFWITDYLNAVIAHFDSTGTSLVAWSRSGADALALGQDTVWVGSFDLGSVAAFARDGTPLGEYDGAGLVETVKLNPTGGVWVGSRDRGLLFVHPFRLVRAISSIAWPIDIDVEPAGALWVVDRASHAVYHLSSTTANPVVVTAPFVDPSDGSLDGHSGLWVADSGRGGVSHVGADLTEDVWFPLEQANAVTWDAPERRLWVCQSALGHVVVLKVGMQRDSIGVETVLNFGGRPTQVEARWH